MQRSAEQAFVNLEHARRWLRSTKPDATDRDLPVRQSALPSGLQQRLTSSRYGTLGDLTDRLADPDFAGLETMPGIGPHRAQLVKGLLDQFGLISGPSDQQAAVERLFPEFPTRLRLCRRRVSDRHPEQL